MRSGAGVIRGGEGETTSAPLDRSVVQVRPRALNLLQLAQTVSVQTHARSKRGRVPQGSLNRSNNHNAAPARIIPAVDLATAPRPQPQRPRRCARCSRDDDGPRPT